MGGPRGPGFVRALEALLLVGTVMVLAGADWPSYLGDGQRDGAAADTSISPANASQLTTLWSFKTDGPIATTPAVVGGVAYVGSWDGYEYALDAVTGAMRWKTYLGVTNVPPCNPPVMGITSSATVQNGVVYVGGGGSNWYALDANTGAILWSVPTGDNSASGGHYNWSSPLILTAADRNTYAYIGVSSDCDSPLVQGQLIQVDVNTHAVVHTFKVVPDGHIGGGIWTSPAADPATNRVYVTTGTIAGSDTASAQQHSEAILALDASNVCSADPACGTPLDAWQVPPSARTTDSDWGTTPTLFTDENGKPLVAAINKNGIAYVWNRGNLAAGPVWQTQIAVGGECPQCGNGSVSSGAFGGGALYLAGGNTTINGAAAKGSVRAFDPATGNIVWQHAAAGVVIPALAYDNGLVIDGAGATLEVLSASTGSRLFSFTAAKVFYGAPSVANGEMFAGSVDGNLYAFGLPSMNSGGPPPTAGYTLDGLGGVHPYGGAPSIAASAYWPNWDIARGLALRPDRVSGYTLDGWGGLHADGAAPAITNGPYWQGWDIARGVVIDTCDGDTSGGSGYVLDGWGGVHAFGTAPAVDISMWREDWDIARGIVLNPCSSSPTSGYVLDGWGGLHPFQTHGAAPIATPAVSAWWAHWDIARGIVITSAGSGYVLDGYGGVHPFGGAGALTASAYFSGQDIARTVTYSAALNGGYVLDSYGGLHPWWINGQGPIANPYNPNHWGWAIARGEAQ
ncbi:MAG: PQQ-binding-like beta-propeller repeat protein [Candidatus Dormibacteraeota bacterium]|nr:PQQ-binding-like beta-propeller repeat protein [Candidatus Dormibacteraeota bacterium]